MKNKIMLSIVALALALFAVQPSATTTWAQGSTYRTSIATSTTGSESAPSSTAWAVGTTYAAGATVVYTGQPWVSLQASNTANTPIHGSAWWAKVGLDLGDVGGFAVFVKTAGTMTAGGKLLGYLFNMEDSKWYPAPDLDVTVSAVAEQGFAGFKVESPSGRIAFVPSGVGLACTTYINGTYPRR